MHANNRRTGNGRAGAKARLTYPVLDIMRFCGALAVMLYHYTAHDFTTWVAPATRFGFLGVPMFFIISGFLISMSLERASSAFHFISDRVIRLYPAFIICSAATVGYCLVFAPDRSFSLVEILANMTMFGEHLKVRLINPAYWSLAVEWVFYLLAAMAWWLGRPRLFSCFLIAWLAASALLLFHDLGVIGKVLILHNAPYFIGGAFIYRLRTGSTSNVSWAVVFLAMMVGILWEFHRAHSAGIEGGYGNMVVALVVAACFGVLGAGTRYASEPGVACGVLGRMSYPLYLVHETIGVDVLTRWYAPGWIGLVVLVGLSVSMMVISFLISEYLERPIMQRLRALRDAHWRNRSRRLPSPVASTLNASQD